MLSRKAASKWLALLSLILLEELARAFPASATSEELENFHRDLLQVYDNRPDVEITMDKALSRVVTSPLDWNVREISTALELRRAICESRGDEYHVDPNTGDDVDYCMRTNGQPSKIFLILTSDIYLRGSKLPHIESYLQMEGRCEASPGRRCAIHAVSPMCSRCELPRTAKEAEEVLCASCRFGSVLGRETTPIRMRGGAKVWLKGLNIMGCRTQHHGGCIQMEASNRLIWDDANGLGDRTTFLRARECTFSNSFAGEEGGVMFLDGGSLALFSECEFSNNFAAGGSRELGYTEMGSSNDGFVEHFAAVILDRCEPSTVEITTLPAPKEHLKPYQQGQVFTADAPPPPMPPSPPPPMPRSLNVSSSQDDDDEQDAGDDVADDSPRSMASAQRVVLICIICIVAIGCCICTACCLMLKLRRKASEPNDEAQQLRPSSTKFFFPKAKQGKASTASVPAAIRSSFISAMEQQEVYGSDDEILQVPEADIWAKPPESRQVLLKAEEEHGTSIKMKQAFQKESDDMMTSLDSIFLPESSLRLQPECAQLATANASKSWSSVGIGGTVQAVQLPHVVDVINAPYLPVYPNNRSFGYHGITRNAAPQATFEMDAIIQSETMVETFGVFESVPSTQLDQSVSAATRTIAAPLAPRHDAHANTQILNSNHPDVVSEDIDDFADPALMPSPSEESVFAHSSIELDVSPSLDSIHDESSATDSQDQHQQHQRTKIRGDRPQAGRKRRTALERPQIAQIVASSFRRGIRQISSNIRSLKGSNMIEQNQ